MKSNFSIYFEIQFCFISFLCYWLNEFIGSTSEITVFSLAIHLFCANNYEKNNPIENFILIDSIEYFLSIIDFWISYLRYSRKKILLADSWIMHVCLVLMSIKLITFVKCSKYAMCCIMQPSCSLLVFSNTRLNIGKISSRRKTIQAKRQWRYEFGTCT